MSALPRRTVTRPSSADAADSLTPEVYELFRRLVYAQTGIHLGPNKAQLVRARLGKRLRGGNFRSFRAYFDFVRADATGCELAALIDAIATNTTHLFREPQHFAFLTRVIAEWRSDRDWRPAAGALRIWSAGCSTGDEPYSIAMTVDQALRGGGLDYRILATDVSTRALEAARAGRYEPERLAGVPPALRRRYFEPDAPDAGPRRGASATALRIRSELRSRIAFRRFNLMRERFTFRHGFDAIFCRNVMIYFDRPTQETLVRKLAAQLRAGGYLLIGHAESLGAIRQPLTYVQPSIYRRGDDPRTTRGCSE